MTIREIDIETRLVNLVTDVIGQQDIPNQSHDAAFIEVALFKMIGSIADARYKGSMKALVAAKRIPDIEKNKCTERTVLYDGANIDMVVEVSAPREMFKKDKAITSLKLSGVAQPIIDKAVDAGTTKTAAPQSVKFNFK